MKNTFVIKTNLKEKRISMTVNQKNYKAVIPVFYACDDAFVKYTVVSMKSILLSGDKDCYYKFHILNAGVSDEMRAAVMSVLEENLEAVFNDVSDYLTALSKSLPLRDYYSKTTYFRMFIADMFKEYDKVIYIDSDTIVKKDISELYFTDLKDDYVGAVAEKVMADTDVYGTYVEKVLGINRHFYFNAGVLLINTKAFRDNDLLKKFSELLNFYDFKVTQDEDYLNVLCKDRITYLDPKWNSEIYFGLPTTEEEVAIFHYIMVSKPWHYKDCPYGEYFWNVAKLTPVYADILKIADSYTDGERERDRLCCENLAKLAQSEIDKEDGYLNLVRKKQAADRIEVLKKIDEYERTGKFDLDVEDDPPTKPLSGKVDYARKKLINKIKAKYAFSKARKFLNAIIKDKKMIVKSIEGIENIRSVDGGAIITCNHFNAYDSFAIQLAYEQADTKKHKFYRVVREGNYTSFGGFYGYLMRNCNTLPLSKSRTQMKKFAEAITDILNDDGFVLVYAEQSMWWNYRKPKPLKRGAFSLAAANGAPIIPCFITMQDSDVLGEDGFYVQEYTIHICKPIYPDKNLSTGENVDIMMRKNAEVWKDVYENFYGVKLRYAEE